MDDYVELHAASAFSFLRAGSTPEALAAAAAEAGMGAMALADRDGLYGAPRFYKACREQGLRSIVGAELTMASGGVLPVLVENRQGYANLCRLITQTQLRGRKGEARFEWEAVEAFSEGLVALSGDTGEGVLPTALRASEKAAQTVVAQMQRAFPGPKQCYIEVQHHLRRSDPRRIRELASIAGKARLPMLATNGVRYATRQERTVLDVFTCLRAHTHLDAAGRLLAPNAERHLKSGPTLKTLFRNTPQALSNTVELAERLEFSLQISGYRFPRYPVPEGESIDSFLRKQTLRGAKQRYGRLSAKVRSQLDHELAVISRLGFGGYFLIVWDIINFCRSANIMVQGRGSAANSAVCYSLGITAVDPIGCKLLFERFLSDGRQGWPDIDLDLPSGERRETVIQEVYRRYGKHGAAMTANVISYRGRSAVREIGKVLNFPPALIDRFSSLYAGGDYPHTLDLAAQLAQAGIPADHPRVPSLIGLYGKIYGLPRHLGQHSGGMIICDDALDQVVPLEPATMPGRVVAQWDKDDCEDLGIVKVDLLGLGMMAAMQDALEIARQRGHPIDLATIPKDDPKTFHLMQTADTIGVFQIESRAQQATLPRMKPACFYDVAIEVAIIRPGPIQGDLVHPYLARRQGRAPVDYIDERLKPVLERTLGVPLYQEQMLQIAMIMADFSGSEAEELRRALNFFKSPDRLAKVQERMRLAMVRKGVAPGSIEKILQATSSFALYGFPESHAISFALLAYASTYLKAHYPAELYCALLNNQPMGFYSPATLIQDAKRHGLRFQTPCVFASEALSTVADDHTIQLGLISIRGLSRSGIDQLLSARRTCAFVDLADLRRRTRIDEPGLHALALSGALRRFGGTRRTSLWELTDSLDFKEDELALKKSEPTDEPPLQAMSLLERIQADYATLGLTAGPHPMRLFRKKLKHVWRAGDLKKAAHGSELTVAGAVICRQRPGTGKGFVFLSLEDETGVANIVVAPQLFEVMRILITREPFLEVRGTIQNRDEVIHLRARHLQALSCLELPAGHSHDFH